MTDEAEDIELELSEDELDIEIIEPRQAQPLWARLVCKVFPFLVVDCPFGNKHWRWSRLCTCAFGEEFNPDSENGWHGGVYDLKTDAELQPCAHCYPEHSTNTHQWSLTTEEECIVQAWRLYRGEVLSSFSEKDPYKYEINVKLNGAMETFLLSRTVGLSTMTSASGLFAGSKRGLKDDKPN